MVQQLACVLLALFMALTSVGQISDIPPAASDPDIAVSEETDSSAFDDEHVKTYYEVVSGIESNTKHDDVKDGWNLYGALAFVVAFFSLCVSWFTLKAQKNTEKHTQKAPLDAQKSAFKDIPRHFYRNLVCTCAAFTKFRHRSNRPENGVRLRYPSESNILKLAVLSDDFVLPIDAVDSRIYSKMHEERLLFRNYNIEIESAARHFSNPRVSDASLQNDYDSLLFKPLYLTARMFEFQDELTRQDKTYNVENNAPYAVYAFVREHFAKLDFRPFLSSESDVTASYRELRTIDSLVSSVGVRRDSIDRGLRMLLANPERTDSSAFLFYTKNECGAFDRNAFVDRPSFISFFRERNSSESPCSMTFMKVLDVASEDDFIRIFELESSSSTKESYALLKPYFDFFQNEIWDVRELFYTILSVDTALEIPKIGMIEY